MSHRGEGHHGPPGDHGHPVQAGGFSLPPADQAVRGLALAALAAALAGSSAGLASRWGILAAPFIAIGAAATLLAGWASLIHLTGGERFDDHPFI